MSSRLSSGGADLSDGNGVIAGLHAQEERLREIAAVNVLLLRPVSFFENFYGSLEVIRHEGISADSVAADLAIPMVATRDIADVKKETVNPLESRTVANSTPTRFEDFAVELAGAYQAS